MSVKYNMQPSDWPVYRDLVMTSPYDDVVIYKQAATSLRSVTACNLYSPQYCTNKIKS